MEQADFRPSPKNFPNALEVDTERKGSLGFPVGGNVDLKEFTIHLPQVEEVISAGGGMKLEGYTAILRRRPRKFLESRNCRKRLRLNHHKWRRW